LYPQTHGIIMWYYNNNYNGGYFDLAHNKCHVEITDLPFGNNK